MDKPVRWNVPGPDVLRNYELPNDPVVYPTLQALAEAGFEKHSIEVSEEMFVKWIAPNWKEYYRKFAAYPLYFPEHVDVRLKPDAAAIDNGVVLPNVNDNFGGEAPDLGAIEFGNDAPVYGPRIMD
jgi:hypothetical protein